MGGFWHLLQPTLPGPGTWKKCSTETGVGLTDIYEDIFMCWTQQDAVLKKQPYKPHLREQYRRTCPIAESMSIFEEKTW